MNSIDYNRTVTKNNIENGYAHLAREKETKIVDCDMVPCVELSTLQEVLENNNNKTNKQTNNNH